MEQIEKVREELNRFLGYLEQASKATEYAELDKCKVEAIKAYHSTLLQLGKNIRVVNEVCRERRAYLDQHNRQLASQKIQAIRDPEPTPVDTQNYKESEADFTQNYKESSEQTKPKKTRKKTTKKAKK